MGRQLRDAFAIVPRFTQRDATSSSGVNNLFLALKTIALARDSRNDRSAEYARVRFAEIRL